jgi:hypothetical protein
VRLPSSVAGLGLCEAADLLEGYKSVASPSVSLVLGAASMSRFLLSSVWRISELAALFVKENIRVRSPFFLLS